MREPFTGAVSARSRWHPDTYRQVEIMLDYGSGKTVTLGEPTPNWWI
ncbi:MAG: hypothetical protein ACI3WQ_02700 [Faecousia sp.]